MRKKIRFKALVEQSLAWKFTAWILVWISISIFTWHFDHINILSALPPDSLANQLYHSGSAYISIKTVVAIISHLSAKGMIYHLLFSGIVTIFGLTVYLIAKEKYSERIAAMSSMIAMVQAYLLLSIGDLNYTLLCILSLPVIILICSWLHPKHGKSYYLLLGLTLAMLFSVPYFWAMLAFAVIMARSRLKVLFKHISRTKKFLLLLPSAIAIVLGFIYSYKRSDFAWLVGDTQDLQLSASKLQENTTDALSRLFIDFGTATDPKLPLIGFALILLSTLSIYLYIQGFSSIQQKIIPSICIGSFVVIVLGLSSLYFVILSGVIIMSVNGLAMLLQQWFTVFPKNPFARACGVTILAITVTTLIATQIISYIELTKLV